MAKRLVCTAVGEIAWKDVATRDLRPGEIRVKNQYGVEKHGTMMAFYKGYGNDRGRWDADALMHRPGEGVLWNYPIPLGNMNLGQVTETADPDWKVGDRALFHGGFQPESLLDGASAWHLAPEVNWQDALMMDPCEFALGAVRDGNVRVGDRVAVFGLGAIGLATVQMARIAGALEIVGIDPIAARRSVAEQVGATKTLDPKGTDVGAEIKGVDVVIDFSGSRHALQAALRGVGYLGTVVCGAFPPPYDGGLDFGGEAHMNRPKIVFTRACSDPNPDHPRWDHARIQREVVALIRQGKIDGEPIISPIVGFEELLEAYPRIAASPETTLKLAVRY